MDDMRATEERAYWDDLAAGGMLDAKNAVWCEDRQMSRHESVQVYVPWLWDRMFPTLSQVEVRPVTLVDVGCGYGRLTFPMAAKLADLTGRPNGRPGAHVVGIDVAPNMIGHALRRAYAIPLAERPPVAFCVNDGRRIPMADASAQGVYSMVTFQHVDVDGVHRYITEAYRVLDAPGVLCFQVVRDHEGADQGFLHWSHHPGRLVDRCLAAGFDHVRCEDTDPHFTNWTWITAEKHP